MEQFTNMIWTIHTQGVTLVGYLKQFLETNLSFISES